VCFTAPPIRWSRREVAAFVTEMGKTPVNWRLYSHPGVVHGFINAEADNAGTPALAYNEAAGRHSWRTMLKRFREFLALMSAGDRRLSRNDDVDVELDEHVRRRQAGDDKAGAAGRNAP
jgi:hypothetical protein